MPDEVTMSRAFRAFAMRNLSDEVRDRSIDAAHNAIDARDRFIDAHRRVELAKAYRKPIKPI